MNNKVYIAIIGILIVACGLLGYKLNQSTDTVEARDLTIEEQTLERDRLELDLERMVLSYDTLQTDNDQLTAEMSAQKAEVEELLAKIKDKNWSIHKLKKEAETLRDIMKGYVVTIDSLNTLNLDLIAQNAELSTRITDVETENVDLKERQTTMEGMIKSGQILQTGNIMSNGVRLRNSGKQVETTRAAKTEMLKTCFTVYENRIAKPGNKDLFMRIIGPDGKVLSAKDGNEEMDFEGETSYFSVKRNIDYGNMEMDVCIFYNVQSELQKGDYKVNIYEGSVLIGSTDISLK
jgi:FtsZ-binding cell division protein ZapB